MSRAVQDLRVWRWVGEQMVMGMRTALETELKAPWFHHGRELACVVPRA